jgi:hypothetical protein
VKAQRCLIGALAILCCLAAEPERPVLRPIHDVDVTYVLATGGGVMMRERLRWIAATRQLRVDPPTQGLYVIIDIATRRMSAVRMAERTVVEMAAPDGAAGMRESAAATAVRRGPDRVAELACTEWDMTDVVGQPTRVCLTDDGVLLRARAGAGTDERTLLTAEAVHYGDLDPGLFQAPAGFSHQVLDQPQTRPQPSRAKP